MQTPRMPRRKEQRDVHRAAYLVQKNRALCVQHVWCPVVGFGGRGPRTTTQSAVDTKLVASKRVIPLLAARGNRLFLGMSDPTSEQLLSTNWFATDPWWNLLWSRGQTCDRWSNGLGKLRQRLDQMIGDDTALGDIDLGTGDEAQVESGGGAPEEVDDAPVVKYVKGAH